MYLVGRFVFFHNTMCVWWVTGIHSFSSSSQLADENQDGFLNREEFAAFLHPEESPRMRPVIIDETMEDMDKDRDGFVTVQEYIGEWTPGI